MNPAQNGGGWGSWQPGDANPLVSATHVPDFGLLPGASVAFGAYHVSDSTFKLVMALINHAELEVNVTACLAGA